MRLYRSGAESGSTARLKLYRRGRPIPLSDCLPVLEHMGVRVMEERPFRIEPRGDAAYVQDFLLAEPDGRPIEVEAMQSDFEETFARVWAGEVEDDGFNALVVHAGLAPRQVAILRAYGKYLRQMAVPFSQELIERTLARHPPIARHLVDLFATRFDPAATGREGRAATRLRAALDAALEAVASLDEDRVLRHYVNLVEATVRTNFFQSDESGRPKLCLVLKLDGRAIEGLPRPRPRFEIFVYSPRFEGVHMRGGRVARGGLRWSDRREDFRTEILGLMKAQMVKNAVIVPVGAKGGFVVKRPPDQGGRDAVQSEGVACYELFINGLLDVTDNLIEGEVVPPRDLVRHDADDPYLVVAADKGTATFSDLANGIARARGFWLDDAFASGGSVGYDHKKMGITARGAWESVKRHFREIGTDIQTRDFTVVGIGDMSGDVFGNGMLLSRHIKLVGAVQPPAHLPRSRPRPADQLSRAAAPVPQGRVAVDRLRFRPDLGGWRRLRSPGEVDPPGARSQAAAWRRHRYHDPQPPHHGSPQGACRPAVERRHRHLRQGAVREPCRGRRPRQRRRPHRRRRAPLQGGRRGRQSRPDPARTRRIRGARRPHQQRRH